MILTTRELNAALNACKRIKGFGVLESRMESLLASALERKVQEIEVIFSPSVLVIKKLAASQENWIRITQFGRR